VLVLDEFFVTDIGDAMLLARLLERMFAEGITLVTTLQHRAAEPVQGRPAARGFPAGDRAAASKHCVVELSPDGHQDYRLRALTRSPVYRTPLDADSAMPGWRERWRELTGGEPTRTWMQASSDRRPPHPGAWTQQEHVRGSILPRCAKARAARRLHRDRARIQHVLLGGIPTFDRHDEDAARRFVNLIDELYDRHVNLVCTSAAAPMALYTRHAPGRRVRAHRLAPDRDAVHGLSRP
jgi:cell division protein ZapE